MWLVPLWTSKAHAMQMMAGLHQNWRWLASLIEVGLIGGGLLYLLRSLLPDAAGRMDRLEETVAERTQALTHANASLQAEIGRRARAQSALERHRHDLETLVEARTAELAESRAALGRSERLASLGTLAAGVAHEINNPIGAILNASQFAMLSAHSEGGEKEAWRALETCIREARRCGDIVRSLLTFHRLDPGQQTREDLHALLRESIADARDYAHSKDVELALEARGERIFALVNRVGIERVFSNLLRNAVEATPAGGRVRVDLRRTSTGPAIEFRDEGRGIAEEDLTRVFDPFFTRRQTHGGTGLGLSVSHGIVSAHEGRIEVESEIGRGATFRVRLPEAALPKNRTDAVHTDPSHAAVDTGTMRFV